MAEQTFTLIFHFSFSIILTKKNIDKLCQHEEKLALDSTEHAAKQANVKFTHDTPVFQQCFTYLQLSE